MKTFIRRVDLYIVMGYLSLLPPHPRLGRVETPKNKKKNPCIYCVLATLPPRPSTFLPACPPAHPLTRDCSRGFGVPCRDPIPLNYKKEAYVCIQKLYLKS